MSAEGPEKPWDPKLFGQAEPSPETIPALPIERLSAVRFPKTILENETQKRRLRIMGVEEGEEDRTFVVLALQSSAAGEAPVAVLGTSEDAEHFNLAEFYSAPANETEDQERERKYADFKYVPITYLERSPS